MNELLDQAQLVEQIEHLIKSKNWYSLTESSRFIWEGSVRLMATMIAQEIGYISPEQIQQIIGNSFTPDALSLANSEYFVDCLLEIDPELILWSEGDIAWQKLKALRTGLVNGRSIRTEFFAKNKIDRLKDIILSLASKSGKEVNVVVIDDKKKNLTHALSLQDQVSASGIIISTYHLSLQDSLTGPAACLSFLSEMTGKNIRLIVDMDGVLINTDLVLSEIVSQKLAQALLNQKNF
ncbi:hypothetical protein KKE34_00840 [Patescibacteria group bacterium]|nr:hypothetical protein [Patescibacteria group bacterium]MBU1885136.1 hypothetical protein [Patescibacteria group bacterium]